MVKGALRRLSTLAASAFAAAVVTIASVVCAAAPSVGAALGAGSASTASTPTPQADVIGVPSSEPDPRHQRHSAAGSCGAAQWQFRDPRRHPNRSPPRSACRAGRALFCGPHAVDAGHPVGCQRCRRPSWHRRQLSSTSRVRRPVAATVFNAPRLAPGVIVFELRPAARAGWRPRARARNPEAYTLDVSPQPHRAFRQRPPRAALRRRHALAAQHGRPPSDTISVPAVHIVDAPRFAWRGLMLDSARHYQSPEFILQFIDWMALHKLNVLHWHLTDDQAWRLEIKKYPRLTSVGAWRVPAGAALRLISTPQQAGRVSTVASTRKTRSGKSSHMPRSATSRSFRRSTCRGTLRQP